MRRHCRNSLVQLSKCWSLVKRLFPLWQSCTHTHTHRRTDSHCLTHMHATTCIPLSYCTSAAARRSRNETQATLKPGPSRLEVMERNEVCWLSQRESGRGRERDSAAAEHASLSLLRSYAKSLLRSFLCSLSFHFHSVPTVDCLCQCPSVVILIRSRVVLLLLRSVCVALPIAKDAPKLSLRVRVSVTVCVCEWVRIAISIGRQQQ